MNFILFNRLTGFVFSEEHGWNKEHADLHPSRDWPWIIYQHTGGIVLKERWNIEDRHLTLIRIPPFQEPEILT